MMDKIRMRLFEAMDAELMAELNQIKNHLIKHSEKADDLSIYEINILWIRFSNEYWAGFLSVDNFTLDAFDNWLEETNI